MISVTISRAELQEKLACDEGMALFESVLALCDPKSREKGRIYIKEWTPLHDVWIRLSRFSAWLEGRRIIPRAYLYGAYLYGVNLYGAYLYGADLYGANLYGADLGGANLGGANLRNADLGGANLRNADLGGADLRNADLGGANLRGAYLNGANLRNAD